MIAVPGQAIGVPYVAFEGPIGAGKTTLATILADYTGWELLLEDVQGNEFLEDFYADRFRWALPMQLSFLVARHEQLIAGLTPSRPAIADHTYFKDAIFARMLLSEERELQLYNRVHSRLSAAGRLPDLIVYLDADNQVLLERIRRRGRKFELAIDFAYIDRIRSAYCANLLSMNSPRIARIDTSDLDIGVSKSRTEFCERIVGIL